MWNMIKAGVRGWTSISTLKQLGIAVVLGILTGIYHPEIGADLFQIAKLVIDSIKGIVVPLVFLGILVSIVFLDDIAKAARLGGGSFLLYTATTIFATFLAVLIAGFVFNNMSFPDMTNMPQSNTDKIVANASEYGGFWAAIFRIITGNFLQAMVDGNALTALVCAFAFGIFILQMKTGNDKEDREDGEFLAKFHRAFSKVIYRFINVIVSLMPFAVFGYVGWMVSTQDPKIFLTLFQMLAVGFSVLVLHVFITYGGMLWFVARVNFFTFLKKFFKVQLFAFSTASSAATIPLNQRTLKEELGVSDATASFTVPFGATVNMDGTGIAQCVYGIFIAHLYGIDLNPGQYATLAVMSSIVSVGVAAVPSASLVTLGVVLGVVGIPLEGIGIIMATDRLLDMARTAVNVTGDAAVSIVMDVIEGRFDRKKFNA